MNFLIDECLALSLANMAIEAGHPESAHVTQRGMGGFKDPKIMRRLLEDDWTFVTRNSDDFRPAAGSSSKRPCYVGVPLHPGLVCLNLVEGATEAEHRRYFRAVLISLAPSDDLTNEVVEAWPESTGVRVERYRFPGE